MPSNYVKKVAKETGKSLKELEKLWDKAKKAAEDEGHKEDFDYITAIFKKMAGVDESYQMKTFEEFLDEKKLYD